MARFEDKQDGTDLLTIEGFMSRFYALLPTYFGAVECAYEATEAEVKTRFNHRKYRGFDSFRSSKSRWELQQRKKHKIGNSYKQAA